MLIGINGYARAGKDTVGEILVRKFGFKRISFADKLREFLFAQNPWIVLRGGAVVRLQAFVNEVGWEKAKEEPDVRELQQTTGTEGGRVVLGPDVWVDAAMRDMEQTSATRFCFTDVRFPNEAEAIRARDGAVWRIRRTGCGPINGHKSETALDGYPFDAIVNNDGTLEDLERHVATLIEKEGALV